MVSIVIDEISSFETGVNIAQIGQYYGILETEPLIGLGLYHDEKLLYSFDPKARHIAA